MAFFCPATGEITLFFEQGAQTIMACRTDLTSFTYSDAVSPRSGKVEHWKYKTERDMSPVEAKAFASLQEGRQKGQGVLKHFPELEDDESQMFEDLESAYPTPTANIFAY